ncbi:hypothetical protein K6025_03020 [Ehrlichia sp. JZT12]
MEFLLWNEHMINVEKRKINANLLKNLLKMVNISSLGLGILLNKATFSICFVQWYYFSVSVV